MSNNFWDMATGKQTGSQLWKYYRPRSALQVHDDEWRIYYLNTEYPACFLGHNVCFQKFALFPGGWSCPFPLKYDKTCQWMFASIIKLRCWPSWRTIHLLLKYSICFLQVLSDFFSPKWSQIDILDILVCSCCQCVNQCFRYIGNEWTNRNDECIITHFLAWRRATMDFWTLYFLLVNTGRV